MTELLQRVIAELEKLPEDEQYAIVLLHTGASVNVLPYR
jgi:hypothetical protein